LPFIKQGQRQNRRKPLSEKYHLISNTSKITIGILTLNTRRTRATNVGKPPQ